MKLGFDESRTWVPPKLIGMLVSFVRGVKCLMIKMKEDAIISFLRQEQERVQEMVKAMNVDTKYVKDFAFGVWITLRCGKCGKDYSTPFNIRDNGRCHKCNKRVYSFNKKTKSNKEKIKWT